MTVTGAGGVSFKNRKKSKRFHKDYDKLDIPMRDLVDEKLQEFTKQPIPSGWHLKSSRATQTRTYTQSTSPEISSLHWK